MKNYKQQNYYELLEVGPESSAEEIGRAYQAAMEVFGRDSVAIYSLFEEEEERESLVGRIQEAYRTLSNSRTRKDYDNRLLGEDFESIRPWRPSIEAEETVHHLTPSVGNRGLSEPLPLKTLVKAEGISLELETGQSLSGADLKDLRQSRKVTLEEVVHRTKVSRPILEAIEADAYDHLPALVYIKGFLKAYARALKLDPDLVAGAYVAGMKKA